MMDRVAGYCAICGEEILEGDKVVENFGWVMIHEDCADDDRAEMLKAAGLDVRKVSGEICVDCGEPIDDMLAVKGDDGWMCVDCLNEMDFDDFCEMFGFWTHEAEAEDDSEDRAYEKYRDEGLI